MRTHGLPCASRHAALPEHFHTRQAMLSWEKVIVIMKQCQEGNLVMGVANFNQEKAGGKTEKWLQQGALNSAFSSFPLLIFPLQGKKENKYISTRTQISMQPNRDLNQPLSERASTFNRHHKELCNTSQLHYLQMANANVMIFIKPGQKRQKQ